MTEIKEAELSSVDAIVGIENSSFTCPWSEKSFNDAISSDKIDVYTVETDGEICGFYCLMIIFCANSRTTVHNDGNITTLSSNISDHIKIQSWLT